MYLLFIYMFTTIIIQSKKTRNPGQRKNPYSSKTKFYTQISQRSNQLFQQYTKKLNLQYERENSN